VIVWSVATQIIKQNIPIGKAVYDLCWDSEGKRIVAVGDGAEQKAKVFAWDTGNNVGTIEFHGKSILSVSYRQQRPFRIVTGSEDLLVNFYEGPPFKFVKSHKEHDRYPNVVRYSPDGAQFASVGSDYKIVIYNGTTGDIVKKVEDAANGHKSAIFSFAWSPDCKQIVTASADRTAKIWNLETGTVTQYVIHPLPSLLLPFSGTSE
jgi:WD40 repeat protein